MRLNFYRGRKSAGVRTLIAAGIAVAIITFPACQTGSTSANGGGPPPAIPSATISFCDDGVPNCPASLSFSVESLRDMMINVSWENLPPGNHIQMLEIMLPGGGLYQSTQTGLFVEGSLPGAASTTRLLPIAGTWITQRQLTGEWTVRAWLDGQAVASQMVQLNP